MLAGRISWCRVCNTTPAAIPIFGKLCRALRVHLHFLHHMLSEAGLGLMKWRCLFCSWFHELKVRLPGAEQSCGTGRWQRTGRNVTVPSLSCPSAPCAGCSMGFTERERFGGFSPLLCVFSKWNFHCHASGLTVAMQFPNAWGDVCVTLQFCHVIKT